jgi:D-alanyl-D-alanine carboxypeptidase
MAGLLISLLTCAPPAAARPDHHHHALRIAARHPQPANPSAGFGPTSPGASTILIDAGNGRVLAADGADIPRYPASLTKLMVLDLAFQALRDGRMSLTTQIPISYHAASVEPVKLGLAPGDTIAARDAILAMTTMSANDAATALGEYLGGGSEARCAQMMTLRAHALGMAQTHFYNASGLPNPAQISTARDLSILARDIVVAFPEDQSFFAVQKFNFRGREIFSNNSMLKTYPGADGLKTGYTILARHNLVTSAVRNGRVLIGVELHEPSWGTTYQHMTAMLDQGFGRELAEADAPRLASAAAAPAANIATARTADAPAAAAPAGAAPATPITLAALTTPAPPTAWAAQLGLFARQSKARALAARAQRLQGEGVASVARVRRNGRTLWDSRLAGLTFVAAHATCDALTARGAACRVVGPPDHLALGAPPAGLGT